MTGAFVNSSRLSLVTFPEPFSDGYGGVSYPNIIVYQEGWEEDAQRVADRLSYLGIKGVSIRGINELRDDEKESGNLILLGTPDFPLIAELNQVWGKLGFFVHCEDGVLKVFDERGEPAAEYGAGSWSHPGNSESVECKGHWGM